MIYIYCDGSSRGNPGPGGFGVVIEDGIYIGDIYGKQYDNITNNQAELKGLILALELASTKYSGASVRIMCDSAYCVNSYNSWISKWKDNNWLDSKGNQIKNIELMKKIYEYTKINFPNFVVEKVEGHAGIIGNELADAAATNNKEKLAKILQENDKEFVGKVFLDF